MTTRRGLRVTRPQLCFLLDLVIDDLEVTDLSANELQMAEGIRDRAIELLDSWREQEKEDDGNPSG